MVFLNTRRFYVSTNSPPLLVLILVLTSRYIDSIVKKFGMKNFKRDIIPMRHGISLSRSISLKTFEERANIDKIP